MFQNGIANCRWGDANLHGGNPYYGTTQAGEIDYSNLSPNGYPSMKIYASAPEIDEYFYAVHPGDHIVFCAWLKTDGTSAIPYGVNIGIDFYGNGYSIDGLPSSGSELNYFSGTTWNPTSPSNPHWVSTTGTAAGYNVMYVRWGTTNWVQMQYDFIVPNVAYTKCPYIAYPHTIPSTYINSVVLWVGSQEAVGNLVYGSHTAWIADSEFYINP